MCISLRAVLSKCQCAVIGMALEFNVLVIVPFDLWGLCRELGYHR